MIKTAVFLLLISTLLICPYTLRGDDNAADKLLMQARAGDVTSQLRLADELMFGRNNRKAMPQLAVYWYRQAALQNSPEGQYNLAICYLQGWGVDKKRPAAAYRYLEKAMHNGVIKAAIRYAEMSAKGVESASDPEGEFPEVKPDESRALAILRKISGYDPEAEIMLAQMLFKHVSKNAGELLELLQKHARRNNAHPEMLLIYSALLRSGSAGICDLNAAAQLLERAAAMKNPEAMAQLAELLHAGSGIPTDHERAEKLNEAAFQAGSPRAMVNRGMEYLTGIRRPHDPHKAFALFADAAKKGYPAAWRQMAFCHAAGIGTPQDERKAFNCYLHAAQGGDAPAMFQLGEYCRLGKGISPNLQHAVMWYLRGAEHGEINAMREAGLALWHGRGIKQDQENGEKWLRRAALAGDRTAAETLNITAPSLF